MGAFGTIVSICKTCLWYSACLVAAADPASFSLSASGRWVQMNDGQSAASDDLRRGLQTSGLAWDGKRLWSVGDQRSAFPGHLFAIDPRNGRLDRSPVPLHAEREEIRRQLEVWGRIDLEGIEVLSRDERRFLVLVEDEATAAMVVRLNEAETQATVEAIWIFEFPGGREPVPYRNDPNYRLEGITIDSSHSRGYVAFERDIAGRPRLYQIDLRVAPATGIGPVTLELIAFDGWNQIAGKAGALLNVNGLELTHTASGSPRLVVLCRDRELFFVLDPNTGRLIAQVSLNLMTPDGDAIEWVSPEGIAIDPNRGVVYIISDPDSTDGNWRLRSTSRATGKLARFVPLLFELKVPTELLR
jgi:uncharacterized protein YjiK